MIKQALEVTATREFEFLLLGFSQFAKPIDGCDILPQTDIELLSRRDVVRGVIEHRPIDACAGALQLLLKRGSPVLDLLIHANPRDSYRCGHHDHGDDDRRWPREPP